MQHAMAMDNGLTTIPAQRLKIQFLAMDLLFKSLPLHILAPLIPAHLPGTQPLQVAM
jgi:hypothetical protein